VVVSVSVSGELAVHEALVDCGQLVKQSANSTVSWLSRVSVKVTSTLPECASGVEADHVAPPLRFIWMGSDCPSIMMLAAETARERPEKIIFVYHALSPSRTVAVAGPVPSHSTSSYETPITPVVHPVISWKTVS